MATRVIRKFFVGNLPWTVGSRELRTYFSEFGPLVSANIIFDRNTGISRGYGFVVFSSDVGLLQLYGLYKQAIAGPCSIPRPSWYQLQAKQKWDAWKELGEMSSEDAMEQYVGLVRELDPGWDDSSELETSKHKIGWVSVSSMPKPDDVVEAEKTVFDWVREGNVSKLEECMDKTEANADIDRRDADGMGLIHWAADRGHAAVLQFLVHELHADVDLRDRDGQTALHYAASCDHSEAVKWLLAAGASSTIADSDGLTPVEVAGSEDTANLFHSCGNK
ncbi:acyl-CoA-binding domain-containing protein 6-like [Bacillus rossius redtenbacheri]|uniref:acyl-CoA-binding domain-containing protein 6-like n=1 Tax=Bacillus rossius redtenbacheri TaxID=93214 RepID=UPI002FDDBE92